MRNRAEPPGSPSRRKHVRSALYGAFLAFAGVTTAFAGSNLWHAKMHPPQCNLASQA